MLPNVPFYKKLFKEYGADFSKLMKVEDWHYYGLPLIKKATYMKNPKDFVVQPDKGTLFTQHYNYLHEESRYKEMAKLVFTHDKKKLLKNYYSPKMIVFSGGTESNNPTPMLLTGHQKFDILMKNLKLIGSVMLKQFDDGHLTGMNLFPYAPHLGWHAVHHALDVNCDLNLCTAAGGALSTERLVMMADKFKPNVICGMNDYLRNRFLPLAIDNKITLPKKVLFINGAQKMIEPERQMIKKLAGRLGVKTPIVLDLYAASELKEALLPEFYPGSGFYHVAPLSTIMRTVEVEKTDKEYITEWNFSEKGYITSWNIDGAGSLLHGYLIGDHAEKVIEKTCSKTGLNAARFYNINRIREVEAQMKLTGMVEAKIKGTRINLVDLREKALKLKDIKEAQIVVNKNKNKLEILYVSQKPQNKKLSKIFSGSEVRITFTRTTIEKLTGGKLKFEPIILK